MTRAKDITMQKIKPCLWFDGQAEEAATFYTSLIPNSEILDVQRAGDAVLTVTFTLAGQEHLALNGGPEFAFNEAISLYVDCETQEEVDELWAKLTDGGEESQCGWLKDRYGLSWQIIPKALPELMRNSDPATAERVMKAMFGMKKISVQELLDAAAS
jgi:predicted 3-demethylubiquinone-9 3-methyltransferase (glyoxalase superfamily)